jgi:hypothetical protein
VVRTGQEAQWARSEHYNVGSRWIPMAQGLFLAIFPKRAAASSPTPDKNDEVILESHGSTRKYNPCTSVTPSRCPGSPELLSTGKGGLIVRQITSGLAPEADIFRVGRHVSNAPISGSGGASVRLLLCPGTR